MNKKHFLFTAFILSVLCSCFRSHDAEKNSPLAVPYKTESRSALFNEHDFIFSLDSVNHTLSLRLSIGKLKKFAFPVNRLYKDTLTKTAFDFTFYFNGKVIASDYKSFHNPGWDADSSGTPGMMSFSGDTVDLREPQDILLEIPFYAFHQLKKGKRSIVLKISQHMFTAQHTIEKHSSSGTYDSVFYLVDKKPLLSMGIRFDLDIPPVYESLIYGYGLALRNDSTFSPSGMDHTIWKSSLPDIYWMLYYPTGSFYAKTPYQASTAAYTGKDTFHLYHYYAEDSIGIGVFDYDNLSRDDGLGYWSGPIKKISVSNINRIRFGYVASFDVKAERKGMVN
jgi:hypothetical protein